MKQSDYIILALLSSILTVIIFMAFHDDDCKKKIPYSSERKELDSIGIVQKGDFYLIAMKKRHSSIVETFKKKYTKDSTTHGALQKIIDGESKEIARNLQVKNKELFAKNTLVHDLHRRLGTAVNIWLLLGIIIGCGILGGVARMYYPSLQELEDLMKKENKVKAKIKKEEDRISERKETAQQSDNTESSAVSDLNIKLEVLSKAKERVEEANKPEQVLRANVIFGIIASLLAFVAIKVFKSDALEFKNVLDYFMLAGWCTLGAVFSKKWLFSIQSKIIK